MLLVKGVHADPLQFAGEPAVKSPHAASKALRFSPFCRNPSFFRKAGLLEAGLLECPVQENSLVAAVEPESTQEAAPAESSWMDSSSLRASRLAMA